VSAPDVFTGLSGTIRVGDEIVSLHRGDEIPAGADVEELDHLRTHGFIGVPGDAGDPATETADVDPFAGEGDAQFEAALEQWVEGSNVKEILAEATTPERAEKLLQIEEAREKPRKSLVDGLTEKLHGGAGDPATEE
jgi:hypothetical protein